MQFHSRLPMVLNFILSAVLAAGCHVVPPVTPEAHGGTCESAQANLVKLDGCTLDTERFASQCHDEQAAKARVGSWLPLDCMTAAPSCKEFLTCKR